MSLPTPIRARNAETCRVLEAGVRCRIGRCNGGVRARVAGKAAKGSEGRYAKQMVEEVGSPTLKLNSRFKMDRTITEA